MEEKTNSEKCKSIVAMRYGQFVAAIYCIQKHHREAIGVLGSFSPLSIKSQNYPPRNGPFFGQRMGLKKKILIGKVFMEMNYS